MIVGELLAEVRGAIRAVRALRLGLDMTATLNLMSTNNNTSTSNSSTTTGGGDTDIEDQEDDDDNWADDKPDGNCGTTSGAAYLDVTEETFLLECDDVQRGLDMLLSSSSNKLVTDLVDDGGGGGSSAATSQPCVEGAQLSLSGTGSLPPVTITQTIST